MRFALCLGSLALVCAEDFGSHGSAHDDPFAWSRAPSILHEESGAARRSPSTESRIGRSVTHRSGDFGFSSPQTGGVSVREAPKFGGITLAMVAW
jgi:hypothetical protein